MARDPKTNGGVDTLYMRQRKVFSPMVSANEKKSQTKLSPTDTDLENGQNWTLVHSGESTASPAHLYQPQGHSHCPDSVFGLMEWR